MAQPIKNKKLVKTKKTAKQNSKKNCTYKKKHFEYGTSKLEEKFAKEFLDKLGIDYVYQYKSEEIGRFYDFVIKIPNGGKILVEIDGDYW